MALTAPGDRATVARVDMRPRLEPPDPIHDPAASGAAATAAAPWSGGRPVKSPPGDLSRRLRSLYDAELHERSRIARDLHDVVGQALTAARLSLMVARDAPDRAEVEDRLDAAIEFIDSALVDVRAIAYDLRPTELDDLGLLAAVRWCLARHERASGVRMVLRAQGATSVESGAHPCVETAVYRIVQEAVTNVVRHAGARRVLVDLRRRGSELRLDVRDDGIGFGVVGTLAARGSTGLPGMYERAQLAGGQLEIRSAAGRGTRVSARFPLRALA